MSDKKASAQSTKKSSSYESNRKTKLEKQLYLQPNNKQVEIALKNIKYRRKTPNKREWSATWIKIAKLFKMFEGRFDRNIMSANSQTSTAAMQGNRKEGRQFPVFSGVKEQNFFTLYTRITGGN